uniref:Uncharacterized protein n=1 Tax=Anguilla anguilla TaxID=7936 RepID=A0A0E9WC63_ANGAN
MGPMFLRRRPLPRRCKVRGSESKSPATCFFHPRTQPADFTNEFVLLTEELC